MSDVNKAYNMPHIGFSAYNMPHIGFSSRHYRHDLAAKIRIALQLEMYPFLKRYSKVIELGNTTINLETLLSTSQHH